MRLEAYDNLLLISIGNTTVTVEFVNVMFWSSNLRKG